MTTGVLERFAMVVTKNPKLTRWEVHKFDCPDIKNLSAHGAFVQYLTAESAQELCDRELAAFPKIGQTTVDCKIMPCCNE